MTKYSFFFFDSQFWDLTNRLTWQERRIALFLRRYAGRSSIAKRALATIADDAGLKIEQVERAITKLKKWPTADAPFITQEDSDGIRLRKLPRGKQHGRCRLDWLEAMKADTLDVLAYITTQYVGGSKQFGQRLYYLNARGPGGPSDWSKDHPSIELACYVSGTRTGATGPKRKQRQKQIIALLHQTGILTTVLSTFKPKRVAINFGPIPTPQKTAPSPVLATISKPPPSPASPPPVSRIDTPPSPASPLAVSRISTAPSPASTPLRLPYPMQKPLTETSFAETVGMTKTLAQTGLAETGVTSQVSRELPADQPRAGDCVASNTIADAVVKPEEGIIPWWKRDDQGFLGTPLAPTSKDKFMTSSVAKTKEELTADDDQLQAVMKSIERSMFQGMLLKSINASPPADEEPPEWFNQGIDGDARADNRC